jgi:hypothetical protein
MKVYIGGYRYRCISNIHARYMNKKCGLCDWDENTNWFETMLEKLEDSLQGLYNKTINIVMDSLVNRRINVRIDRSDTWGMDETLSHIIIPMLKQLIATKHGAPWVDDEDVPDELKSTSAPPKENDWDTDDNHFKRWDYVLDEMLWSFEQKARDNWESDYYEFEDDPAQRHIHDLGLKYVWEDKEGSVAHQKRMTNGFRLFGKFYENLWD